MLLNNAYYNRIVGKFIVLDGIINSLVLKKIRKTLQGCLVVFCEFFISGICQKLFSSIINRL